MGSETYREWVTIFQICKRRSSLLNKYSYRGNIPQSRKLKELLYDSQLKHFEQQKNIKPILTNIYAHTIFNKLQLKYVRKIILEDMKSSSSGKGKNILQYIRTENSVSQVPSDIKNKCISLLGNPMVFLPNSSNFPKFDYQYIIKLIAATNDEKIPTDIYRSVSVAWPNPIYSNYCVGLGINSALYDSLSEENFRFINPANGELLPLYIIDEFHSKTDAIALCPKLERNHRKYFEGTRLIGYLSSKKLCEGNNQEKLINRITGTIQNVHKGNELTTAVELVKCFNEKYPKNTSQSRSKELTLDNLFESASMYKSAWSTVHDEDRSCPGDIIRNVIISSNYNNMQIREELMKNYAVHNILSFCGRLLAGIHNLESFKNISMENNVWSPWDLYIVDEYQKLNTISLSLSGLSIEKIKKRFDCFLEKLFRYQSVVICEMKNSSNSFFGIDVTSNKKQAAIPRVVLVTIILSEIFQNCKWYKTFYPNLSLLNDKFLTNIRELTLPFIKKDTRGLDLGQKIDKIIFKFNYFESIIYNYKFTLKDKTYNIENAIWKIVVLDKCSILEDVAKILKFNNEIPFQFVKSLEDARGLSNFICLEKGMIDNDTFVYLFKEVDRNVTPTKKKFSNYVKYLRQIAS